MGRIRIDIGYRKVWLISVCAYHSRWYGNMHLLDELIESEVLSPPTASTFVCSLISYGSMIGSHHWKEKQSIDLFGESCFEVEDKSPTPSQWRIAVLRSHAAGYPKNRLVNKYYCCLYWAYALIKKYAQV